MEFELFTDGAEDDYAFGAEDIDNEQEQLVFDGNEGQRCGICMDVVVDRGVLDCCQHWFCFSCIDNWASITNLCPLCQSEFQLITCVPVYDTVGNIQLDDESYSRDDDWSIEGTNNTLSFPSYYIDENAVSCLEGDSCKIRGQSANLEEDPDLDTSIACDSCDLWYHAICVGFDTEGSCENSWLCPRCIANETSQKSELGLTNITNVENSTFPMNVSVSVADAGETAVVVSIIDGNQQTEVHNENMEISNDLKIGNQENEEICQIMLPGVFEDKTKDDDNSKLENQLDDKIIKTPKLEPVEEDLQLSNFQEELSVPDESFSPEKNLEKKKKTGGVSGLKRKQRDSSVDEVETKVKKIVKTEKIQTDSKNSSTSVAKKRRVETDIRDIVQGPYRKPSEDKGVRIKKIIKRTTTDDKDSLTLVQNLRKEIRDTIRNRSSKETEDKNLFDPNLLAAFRTALMTAGQQTDAERPPLPLNMKAKKALLQKGTVRENLTKKIYGVGGKRKRAWTRDCEIEFWKHRCTKIISKPEKIETLKSVLDLLRKGPEAVEVIKKENTENAPGDGSILSRLYVADSSVFPRKDDIKPLSASGQVSDGKETKVTAPSTKGKKVILSKSLERSAVNAQKESGNGSSDVKVDKRKWAMEVLARKTAVTGNNSTQGQDNAVLKGNYPLLAKLPVEMRPSLATSRHNKIPLSVRQAQLYRLTEHFLKMTKKPVTPPTAEIELAIADAINIEKSVADKSNSKLVYTNLISQELLHRSDNPDSEPKSPPVTLDNSATTTTADVDADMDIDVNEALRNAGLLSDSPPNSPLHKTNNTKEEEEEENGVDNVFEKIDEQQELDIYGDFEYDLEDENFVTTAVKTQKVLEGDTKIKMVFSTLDWRFEDNEAKVTVENGNEDGNNNDDNDNKEEGVDECEELYGPDKEPLIEKYPEIKPIDLVPEKIVEENVIKSPKKVLETVEMKEKKTTSDNKKQESEKRSSVFKKVEAYIKEHIRPLCKSGVITVDQYRWAVGKTTDKIMKFHSKDTNANFLIKEGEKVKKLAEQYVEAAQKVEK